jgi:uncharacterized protein YjbI with pentapeptide repeats
VANEEHLAILRQGAQAWNEWRAANPQITPDLSSAELRNTDLGSFNLADALLANALLLDSDLSGADLSRANLEDANLVRARLENVKGLQSAKLSGAHLVDTRLAAIDLRGKNLVRVDLSGADLSGAIFAGANLTRASLSAANLTGANLESADLSHARLLGVKLESANLANACLDKTKFSYFDKVVGASLRNANLANASAHGADFTGADLTDADLRGADLKDANLKDAKGGLRPGQLADTDLSGATLSDPLTKLFDKLEAIGNISESARKLFIALLAACLYSWLTVATTTDLNLITNRASSPLPIIQTAIPIVGFYWVAPLLLLCVFFYFHFYLQKLWEELGSLPAIFPDGRRLHERSDPWLLNDLVRAHVPRLKADRPFMSYFQQFISIILAWWLVPLTLMCFWLRYLPRHGSYGTDLHVGLLAISIMAAVFLYRLAARTLRGAARKPFSWSSLAKSREGHTAVAVLLLTIAVFYSLSWYSSHTMLGICNALGYVVGKEAQERFYCFASANLQAADISVKPPNWVPKYPRQKDAMAKELEQVVGAQLPAAHLQYAYLGGAFLAKANLSTALMDDAVLSSSDLRMADLTEADLPGAELNKAHLNGAKLSGANLSDADLNEAYSPGADLALADLTGAQINEADLNGADLTLAHLDGAYLTKTGLTGANLTGARLNRADLTGADLTRAYLKGAGLTGAILDGADLTLTDFRSSPRLGPTRGLEPQELRAAHNWENAYYDTDILNALGLPADHNHKLAEQQRREEEEQKKKQGESARP